MVSEYFTNLSEYFLGTWSKGRAKPYLFTQQQRARLGIKGRRGEADRELYQYFMEDDDHDHDHEDDDMMIMMTI